MGPAESAILLDFHPVGMSLLILSSIIVTLLALCTSQSDFCTHVSYLHLLFEHKKKT